MDVIPPTVATVPIGTSTLGALVDAHARIGIEGSGPLATRKLVPESAGAQKLLTGPTAPAATAMLRGVLGALDARAGTARLRGISMSTSPAGFVANKLLSNVETGAIAAPSTTDAAGQQALAKLAHKQLALSTPPATTSVANTSASLLDEAATTKQETVKGSYTRGWLDIGPEASIGMAWALEHPSDDAPATRILERGTAYVLAHELGHATTPPPPRSRVNWLEEGTAETLARWPGMIEKTARAVHLNAGVKPLVANGNATPFDSSLHGTPMDTMIAHPYDAPVASIRALLRARGVNPDDPNQFPAAEQLLQVPAANDALQTIAAGLATPQVPASTLVRKLLDTRGNPEAVQSVLGRLQATKRQIAGAPHPHDSAD